MDAEHWSDTSLRKGFSLALCSSKGVELDGSMRGPSSLVFIIGIFGLNMSIGQSSTLGCLTESASMTNDLRRGDRKFLRSSLDLALAVIVYKLEAKM